MARQDSARDFGSLDELVKGVLAGDRTSLGRALTLVESRHPQHQLLAQSLLREVGSQTGKSIRIGVSGLPGAGKSTLIEALGVQLVQQEGLRIAVLAVDPSSTVTGGSILGDKTRMTQLSMLDEAFVRPSPTGGSLGGVTQRTQEALLILESAGYDVVFVETVGVGQSEAAVANMVDSLVVVQVPNTGDELQGIKRGLLELVDILVINKNDGSLGPAAETARRDYAAALNLVQSDPTGWRPRVLTTSAIEGRGVSELWQTLSEHRRVLEATGALVDTRGDQKVRWMWQRVEERLIAAARSKVEQEVALQRIESRVISGELTPIEACETILESMNSSSRS